MARNYRKKARRAAAAIKGATRGAKGTAMAAAVGAVSMKAASYLDDNVDFIKNNWWGKGAALLVAGHFVAQKHHDIGRGLAGAAGAILMNDYEEAQDEGGTDSAGFNDGYDAAGWMGGFMPDAGTFAAEVSHGALPDAGRFTVDPNHAALNLYA